MNSYVRESLTFKFFDKINVCYKNSLLNEIFLAVGSCYKSSFTHKVLLRHFTKNPTFAYSRTYKIIHFIAEKLNTQMSKLHRITVSKAVNSKSYAMSDTFKKEMKRNFTFPLIAFLVPFIVGYSLFVSVENTWGMQSLIIVAILILLVAISALTGSNWPAWIKNSSLYKFFKFIWE